MSERTALNRMIAEALARLPEWIRHDLGAKDAALRARAEETLAAMIASSIEGEAA